jgi:hypothetical protein
MGEVISGLWQHYSVEILVAVIIAAVLLSARIVAALLTSIFSPIKISGDWETKLDRGSGLKRHEDVKVRQFIHRVWGRATSVDGRSFRFRGSIVGDRVCLVYRAKSPSTDCGANLLKLMAHGKELKGYEVGIDRDTDQPQTYKYEWTRKL